MLPFNATADERALEEAMRSGIDLSSVGTLWNPQTCPAAILPYLGWALAISHWDTAWSEAEKREAVAKAIPFHKITGTRAAVEQVLARFSPLLTITEWWETEPRGTPHTFEVRADVLELGSDFLSPDTANAIIADIAAAKPLRAHFDFVQTLSAQAALFMAAGGMAGSMLRIDATTEIDTSRDWSLVLQTDDGEPLRDEDGNFLEDE